MIVREAVLNHPEVAELLKEEFVCFALDNRANPNVTDSEKEFLAERGGRSSTVGLSIFTAGGEVLAKGSSYTPEPTLRKMKQALAEFEPESPAEVRIPELTEPERQAARGLRTPPEGGLVLNVTWKLLETDRQEGSKTTGGDRYADCFANSLGVDRLWVRADEADELADGALPESLVARIRPHMDYVLAGKIDVVDLTLEKGRLSGTVLSDSGDRATLRGFVESNEGRVNRFELLVKGVATRLSNAGFSAGLAIVPKGEKVPVALMLSLADPENDGDLWRIVPHRSRYGNYLK